MKERPHTCRLESVIYEHATHFVFPESMLKTMLPIGSGIFMKLAFQAARKYPKECQGARMDIDQRVRNAVAEWKSTERQIKIDKRQVVMYVTSIKDYLLFYEKIVNWLSTAQKCENTHKIVMDID